MIHRHLRLVTLRAAPLTLRRVGPRTSSSPPLPLTDCAFQQGGEGWWGCFGASRIDSIHRYLLTKTRGSSSPNSTKSTESLSVDWPLTPSGRIFTISLLEACRVSTSPLVQLYSVTRVFRCSLNMSFSKNIENLCGCIVYQGTLYSPENTVHIYTHVPLIVIHRSCESVKCNWRPEHSTHRGNTRRLHFKREWAACITWWAGSISGCTQIPTILLSLTLASSELRYTHVHVRCLKCMKKTLRC